ncbi:hypothetical protein LTR02_006162 [Friedmanniomyces endolithicus]|nr:hypothetical protein LTR02_006162 [Friedmanniomyces endolithicus]KAK1042746.1 hypothetical protein LTS16_008491 [Friedmanniomyces endolithicus]
MSTGTGAPPYLDAASRYDLADQDDIVYPDQSRSPIKELPVHDGLLCLAKSCSHLCITEKRMQAHWREHHPGKADAETQHRLPRWRPAKLQTFLRGNNLRYFIVSDRPTPTTPGRRELESQTILESSLTNSFSHIPHADPRETEVDWLLTHHFFETTSRNLSLCATRSQDAWRDKMLQNCATHPFLRYAVLSITASHVAWRCVDVSNVYAYQASRYLQMAMDRMSRVAGVTADNFFAFLNFCRLMSVCCLAGLQRATPDTDMTCADREALVPTWVNVQRQGISLLRPHRQFMMKGLHEPSPSLLNVHMRETPTAPSNAFDARLTALMPLTTATGECDSGVSHTALLELRRLWTLATSTDDGSRLTLRDAALLWPVRVPSEHLDAVQAGDLAALLVLAHYCVILRLAEEECWYARGHAQALLSTICKRMEPSLCHLLIWPTKVVRSGCIDEPNAYVHDEQAQCSANVTMEL